VSRTDGRFQFSGRLATIGRDSPTSCSGSPHALTRRLPVQIYLAVQLVRKQIVKGHLSTSQSSPVSNKGKSTGRVSRRSECGNESLPRYNEISERWRPGVLHHDFVVRDVGA
jgi:hypothetical protein